MVRRGSRGTRSRAHRPGARSPNLFRERKAAAVVAAILGARIVMIEGDRIVSFPGTRDDIPTGRALCDTGTADGPRRAML